MMSTASHADANAPDQFAVVALINAKGPRSMKSMPGRSLHVITCEGSVQALMGWTQSSHLSMTFFAIDFFAQWLQPENDSARAPPLASGCSLCGSS